MNKKASLFLMILASLTILACTAQEEGAGESPDMNSNPIESPLPISIEIIGKAEEYIVSQTGRDFFDQYISFDSERSQYYPADDYCVENPSECASYLQEPHYLMVFTFKIPENAYVDELIEMALDSDGNIISEREPYGIPNCVEDPIECEFPIDESEAISTAEEAGLEPGISDWEINSIYWYSNEGYVFSVSNTLKNEDNETSGQSVIVDANTGEILGEIMNWMTTYTYSSN